MRLIVELNGERHEIELRRDDTGVYMARLGERVYRVDVHSIQDGVVHMLVNGLSFDVGIERVENNGYRLHFFNRIVDVTVWDAEREGGEVTKTRKGGEERIRAPMSGRVVAVHKKAGDPVEAGETLIVMEAMKMQNEIRAEHGGIVQEVRIKDGATVRTGDLLIIIRPA